MTISTTANKIIYSGNGVTVSFPFTFPAIAAADIQAYYTDSSGNITTLVQGSGTTQYQVSLNAAVPPNPTAAGGTVTYNPSGTPIAVGTTLTIIRTQSLVQSTSLANQGTLYPAVIEQAFDSLLAQTQQLNELLGRAISVAVSDPTPADLPAAAARANKYLSFDSNGDPTASASSPGTTPVSSTMAAFVNAASLASARTLLGLGNIAVETIGSGLQDDGAGTLRVNLEVTTADTTNQTVTSAFHNTQRVGTGPFTYALPRANTLWNGFGFKVEALQASGSITFSVNIADTFQNYVSGTSFVIARGTSIEIWTDAAASGTWYYRIIGGRRNPGDADNTLTPTDNLITTSALTAPRTWTLPSAAAFKAGKVLVISDEANVITPTNTITIARAGADTIVAQGTTVTSMVLRNASNSISLISDGISKWNIIALRFKPTVTRFASSTGTYTPPVGCSYLRVTMCAGGGGGGAVITNSGAAGANTTFGSWGAVAGGGGGAANGAGGAGGAGGSDDTATGLQIWRQSGQTGSAGSNAAGAFPGSGGQGPFGGGGLPNGAANSAGQAAVTNSGGGGAGASGGNSGGGGGSGEFVIFFVFNPAAVSYAVGAGGAGGAAGTAAGGAGGSGVIIVEEFYN